MAFFSIAIPAFEMNGRGTEVLEYCFQQIAIQSFKDVEIIVADQSMNYLIDNLCSRWKKKLNIKYYKNDRNRGSPSANTNFSISKCTSDYISIMCMDDYFLGENALQNIYN